MRLEIEPPSTLDATLKKDDSESGNREYVLGFRRRRNSSKANPCRGPVIRIHNESGEQLACAAVLVDEYGKISLESLDESVVPAADQKDGGGQ